MTAAMKVSESSTGLVSCACWDSHATLKIKKSGILILLFSGFMYLSLISIYVSVLVRKEMPAFLPFVSQAGGQPPANGIFAIFNELMIAIGLPTFLIIFETINQRNVRSNKVIKYLNIFSLFSIIIAGLGMILTSCFPVGYTDLPNKFQWVITVLSGHSFGSTLALIGLVLYQFGFVVIFWILPDATKKETYIKLGFCVTYIAMFCLIVYPIPMYIIEQLGPNVFDFELMKTISYSLPKKYSVVYLINSFCEWAIIILSFANVALLFKDLQRVSCIISVRPKSCLADDLEEGPRISLKVIS